MDREELLSMFSEGAVRISMNDGREYTIEHTDEAVVSDISAYVLYRGDDGKLRRVVLPLVTMSAVHPLSDA